MVYDTIVSTYDNACYNLLVCTKNEILMRLGFLLIFLVCHVILNKIPDSVL